ncbi:hypothetical protein GMRT_13161 [Giardia muris]|uniref:Uncharacterized protein n=1 Tax=Giardia muris TaxID=5742 RepID=A0A4Z1T2N2_GIAMU|nr:hypothetical protein GMRT_13161 [Giardia muris]|eukprot:TNJ26681.1 hypothetical protein GMRT_13161 [Giardia muris]
MFHQPSAIQPQSAPSGRLLERIFYQRCPMPSGTGVTPSGWGASNLGQNPTSMGTAWGGAQGAQPSQNVFGKGFGGGTTGFGTGAGTGNAFGLGGQTFQQPQHTTPCFGGSFPTAGQTHMQNHPQVSDAQQVAQLQMTMQLLELQRQLDKKEHEVDPTPKTVQKKLSEPNFTSLSGILQTPSTTSATTRLQATINSEPASSTGLTTGAMRRTAAMPQQTISSIFTKSRSNTSVETSRIDNLYLAASRASKAGLRLNGVLDGVSLPTNPTILRPQSDGPTYSIL